jgi:hypothetical protein
LQWRDRAIAETARAVKKRRISGKENALAETPPSSGLSQFTKNKPE